MSGARGVAFETELRRVALYRDVLSERMLYPPGTRLGMFVPRPPPGVLFREGGQFEWGAPARLVAFALGVADNGPELVAFADRHDETTVELQRSLGRDGVRSRVVTGVSFHAAGSRPVQGGHSVGRGAASGESGTFGCVVASRSNGTRYGLTCNHVIADLNAATRGATEVWAPSALRGGTAPDRVGVVHDFLDIDFAAGATNLIDAALILPDHAGDLDPTLATIGAVAGVNTNLVFGDGVEKHGAASAHTSGRYRYRINAQIQYGGGRTAIFHDLIGLVGTSYSADFAKRGDSGAVVVDALKNAVGLVISVADGLDLTLATPIRTVLDHFDVDVI